MSDENTLNCFPLTFRKKTLIKIHIIKRASAQHSSILCYVLSVLTSQRQSSLHFFALLFTLSFLLCTQINKVEDFCKFQNMFRTILVEIAELNVRYFIVCTYAIRTLKIAWTLSRVPWSSIYIIHIINSDSLIKSQREF